MGSALTPAAAFRGTTEGASAAWLLDVAGAAVRVAVVATLAVVAGTSLAIGRNAAAALAAGFVYALVEVFIRGFDNPAWQRWLIGENVSDFATARAATTSHPGFSTSIVFVLLVDNVGALFAAPAASFLRRDAS